MQTGTLDGERIEVVEKLRGYNPRHGWVVAYVIRRACGHVEQLSVEVSRRVVLPLPTET